MSRRSREIRYSEVGPDVALATAWMDLLSEQAEQAGGIPSNTIVAAAASFSAQVLMLCAAHGRETVLHAEFSRIVANLMLNMRPVAGNA